MAWSVASWWRGLPGKYFFLCTKRGTDWKDHMFERSELNEVHLFIFKNTDKDVYFCPHGFSQPRRLAKYAVPPRALWADLDEADPREILVEPTVAIQSSPGRYVGLWTLDETMTPELNRALTYKLGADKGGWDFSQVLRVPGTFNHKYNNDPKVKLLWDDGPTWTVRKIEKLIGKVEIKTKTYGDAAEVFKKYESKLPASIRRKLIGEDKPMGGVDRSKVGYGLQRKLIEVGMSVEEATAIFSGCPWNKHAEKARGDEQLEREFTKILDEKLGGGEVEVIDRHEEVFDDLMLWGQSLENVQEEKVDWVWPDILARGEITLLDGDPGIGKSYWTHLFCVQLCNGGKLPLLTGGEFEIPQGRVYYCDLENAASYVTKPRLRRAGLKNFSNFIQNQFPFSVDNDEDLDRLYDELDKWKPEVLVMDTMNTYMGRADAHKGHEIVQSLNKIKLIAREFDVSVLMLRHLKKGKREDAMQAGQGSMSIVGVSRVQLVMGRYPDEEDMTTVMMTKTGLGPFRKGALTYQWSDKGLDFCDVEDDINVEDTINKGKEKFPDKGEVGEKAENLIRQMLDGGPQDFKDISLEAEKRGISNMTLNRASNRLEVIKKLHGKGTERKSIWSLPDD